MIETRISNFASANRFSESTPLPSVIGRKAVGYGAVFYNPKDPAGTQYQLWQGCFERIDPHAFDSSLKSGRSVRGLFNHDPNFLLGSTASGTMRLSVDRIGLRYEIDIPDTSAGRDIAELLGSGRLCGSSFMFSPTKVVRYSASGDEPDLRIITDMVLFECGPVVFPAYESASSGLRSEPSTPTRISTTQKPVEYSHAWEDEYYQELAAERKARQWQHDRDQVAVDLDRQRQRDRDQVQIFSRKR